MRDILEHFEAVAEAQYDDMLQPNGMLKCRGCGELFKESEGTVMSPNPYAMPVCGDCFEEAVKEVDDRKGDQNE